MAVEFGVATFLDHNIPYNLENGEQVVNSYKYEYSLFELVRIYKAFDWKNNIMIYYGY